MSAAHNVTANEASRRLDISTSVTGIETSRQRYISIPATRPGRRTDYACPPSTDFSTCSMCQQPAGEIPVPIRRRDSIGCWAADHVVCRRCATSDWRGVRDLNPEPAECPCGRRFWLSLSDSRGHWRTYCSLPCAKRFAMKRQRQRRVTDRTRICSTCAATFTPTRSDARYCSSRCRQRAYRARNVSHGGQEPHKGEET